MAAIVDKTKTMAVATPVSFRVGQVTFAVSCLTCLTKSAGEVFAIYPMLSAFVQISIRTISDLVRYSIRVHSGRVRSGFVAGAEGLEPTAPGFGDRCSTN